MISTLTSFDQICPDRSKLSDEIAPDLDLSRSPLLAMLPGRSR